MITKWIQFKVREDSAETFFEELAAMQKASRLEAGCAHYSVYRAVDDPCVLTVLESWESAENLEAHRLSPHMAVFKERCAASIVDKQALDLEACPT